MPSLPTNRRDVLRAAALGFTLPVMAGGSHAAELPPPAPDSVKAHGAACDGVADDTAAVQACIDSCLASGNARPMLVPGPCRITRPLIIDRPVDTTTSEFRIIGEGPAAGFLVDGAFNLFDSTLRVSADPKSEFVTFSRIDFEAKRASDASFVMSPKFLRIRFDGCNFRKIRVLNSPTYAQSYYFTNCDFRRWLGVSFKASAFMDCHFIGNIWEFGQDGIASDTGGAAGLRIIGNLFEGSRRFFRQASGSGLTIMGNYTEGNAEPDYCFTSLEKHGAAKGTLFAGNYMAVTHAAYNVTLGDIRGFVGQGNYCTTKLYDMAGTRFGRLVSIGDHADGSLFSRDSSADTGSGTACAVHKGGVLAAGLNLVNAGSAVLPPSDDVVDGDVARVVTVVNQSGGVLRVGCHPADVSNFAARGSWTVPAGASATFYQVGQGVAVRG